MHRCRGREDGAAVRDETRRRGGAHQVPPGPSRQIEESWLVWDAREGASVMHAVLFQWTQSSEYAQTPIEQWPFE